MWPTAKCIRHGPDKRTQCIRSLSARTLGVQCSHCYVEGLQPFAIQRYNKASLITDHMKVMLVMRGSVSYHSNTPKLVVMMAVHPTGKTALWQMFTQAALAQIHHNCWHIQIGMCTLLSHSPLQGQRTIMYHSHAVAIMEGSRATS